MATPVALITGASAGLGVDFARQLSAQGHRLVLVARRLDRLEELAAELGNARAVACDLSTAGAVAQLMADLAAHDETVETLVNNAGFGLWGRFFGLDAKQQREMVDLNVGALTELTRAVAPGMVERKQGRILNLASTAAFQPGPRMAVYFATKAYVLSLTEALHEELKPYGISVSALCPGPTKTEFGEIAGFSGSSAFARISASSSHVARVGLHGLARNKAVVIPGLINKAGAQGHRVLPRWLLRKVTGSIGR